MDCFVFVIHVSGRKERRLMNNDPWERRSKGMACKTCMWFVIKIIKQEARTLYL